MTQRRRTVAVLVGAAAAVLGPVLLAGPAAASGTLPDEPPGGATCAPEAPATDCQQEPADPAPSDPAPADPSPSAPAPAPTETKAANPTTLPTTGGSKPVSRPALAHTGTSETVVYGVSGGLLLLMGSGLVLAARRTVRA